MAKDPNNPYSMYPDDPEQGFDPRQDARPGHMDRGNSLGLIGFIMSLLGPLAPVGVVMCLFALKREPRGLAIAGIIVGIVVSLVTFVCGGLIMLGIWAWSAAQPDYEEIARDYASISRAVEQYQIDNGSLPPDLEALNLPPDDITDPFGERYIYTQRSGTWSLGFKGVDGVAGTDDDAEIPAGATIGDYRTDPYQPLQEALTVGRAMDAVR